MARIDMPEGANVAVPGEYSLIQAALSNKGNPTSQGFGNLMVVEQSQPVRIVDKSGEVLFEGIGPDAARQAVAIGQNLSDTQGNKAGWNIQTVPVGAENYATIANEKANKSVLGAIADVALPIAAGFIPGVGPVLGAALGSTASSVAQGRSLQDTLLRAGLSAAGSAAGGSLLGKISDPLSNTAIQKISDTAVQNAVNAGNSAVSGVLGSIYGSAAGSAAGSGIAPSVLNAANLATDAFGNVVDETGAILVSGTGSGVGANVGSVIGGGLLGAAPSLLNPPYTPPSEEIIVTAGSQPTMNFGGAVGALPLTPTPPVETPPTFDDEIIVTAPKDTVPFSPPIFVPPGILPPTTPPTTPPEAPAEKPPADKKDILGTGLTASELALIGGLGSSVIGSLFGGGGGGTGATTPYVSPFGAGTGFGTGMDYRAQPNILDYERYGFGPEAMFFRPEYNRLVSGASAAPASSTAATNSAYTPLISGGVASGQPSANSPMTEADRNRFLAALGIGSNSQPAIWNGPYVGTATPTPTDRLPSGAENAIRGLIG